MTRVMALAACCALNGDFAFAQESTERIFKPRRAVKLFEAGKISASELVASLRQDPVFAELELVDPGNAPSLLMIMEDIHGTPDVERERAEHLRRLGINVIGLEGWRGPHWDRYNGETEFVEEIVSDDRYEPFPLEGHLAHYKTATYMWLGSFLILQCLENENPPDEDSPAMSEVMDHMVEDHLRLVYYTALENGISDFREKTLWSQLKTELPYLPEFDELPDMDPASFTEIFEQFHRDSDAVAIDQRTRAFAHQASKWMTRQQAFHKPLIIPVVVGEKHADGLAEAFEDVNVQVARLPITPADAAFMERRMQRYITVAGDSACFSTGE